MSLITNHSPTWRNILQAWQYCQLGLQWKISTGTNVNFWNDPWIKAGTILRSLVNGPLPLNHQSIKIASLYNYQGWNWAQFPFELTEDIKNIILTPYISLEDKRADRIYWALIPNGKFTVNSMYRALEKKSTDRVNTIGQFQWIWKLPIHPKVKHFIWLLNHNRLSTRQFLQKINIIVDATCLFCHEADETLNHIFLTHANARHYWHNLGMGRHIDALLIWIRLTNGYSP